MQENGVVNPNVSVVYVYTPGNAPPPHMRYISTTHLTVSNPEAPEQVRAIHTFPNCGVGEL